MRQSQCKKGRFLLHCVFNFSQPFFIPFANHRPCSLLRKFYIAAREHALLERKPKFFRRALPLAVADILQIACGIQLYL